MLRECVLYNSPPLRGVSWLLNNLKYTDAIWHRGFGTVIDDDTWKRLLERCWAASGGIERRDAIFVLGALIKWHESHIQHLASQVEQLGRWLQEVDIDTTYSIADLLGYIYEENPKLSKKICNEANPTVIAAQLVKIRASEAYSWGRLLAWLPVASPKWQERLVNAFDVTALRDLVLSADESDLYGLSELILRVYVLNRDLGLELAELSIPVISAAINSDPIHGYTQAGTWLYWEAISASRSLAAPAANWTPACPGN
jgi:hypothetical protein